MRRIWILVPFWAFFIAYLVYHAHTRQAGEAAALPAPPPAGSAPAPRSLDAPVPHLPPAQLPATAGSTPARRVRETLPAVLDAAALTARVAPVSDRVHTLPRAPVPAPVSFLWPVDAEGSPDHPDLLALASRSSFPRWKLHEDEWLSFYYPDDPSLVLEILDADAPFPMIGETMWTVADAPERRYRIATTGGGTFCLISLEKAPVPDDTPRFPRPEVFRREWSAAGSLHRASLMADGRLRRVEILAGGDRASVLDWPHCAIHRDVYDLLALSVRLNGPVADGDYLLAARRAVAGPGDRLGHLDPGMDEAAVLALLGQPASREGETLLYREVAPPVGETLATGHAGQLFRVPLPGGRFSGLARDWRESLRLPPAEGSFPWMLAKTGGTAGDEGTGAFDPGPLTEEETAAMFDRFCAEAPGAGATDWDAWCRILANLAELGARDDRVPAHLGARFLDPALPQGNATQLLHAYDPEGGRDLFAARLRALLGRPADGPLPPGFAHDIQILLAYLGGGDERSAPLVEAATRHPDPAVRATGYGYLPWLPGDRVAALLGPGLVDADPVVRRRSAEALCGEATAPGALLDLVARRLAEENDPETRAYLEEARRLHAPDTGTDGAARAPAPPDDGASS